MTPLSCANSRPSAIWMAIETTSSTAKRAAGAEALGEVLALDQLHDEDRRAVDLLDAEEGGDAGVVQGGQGARFAVEAGQAFRVVGELRRQQLEGDFAAQLGVAGAVDLTHAALAEQCGDFVVGEGLADQMGAPRIAGSVGVGKRSRPV